MTLKATKDMAEFAQKCTHKIVGFNLHRQGAALLPKPWRDLTRYIPRVGRCVPLLLLPAPPPPPINSPMQKACAFLRAPSHGQLEYLLFHRLFASE
jgi:hypothetical protein